MNVVDRAPERNLWIINTGDNIECINVKLKKHLILKNNIPIQLPMSIAMEYVKRYQTVQFCQNPDDYFKEHKLKRLVVRDAGIGDLLMLEPVLQKLSESSDVYVACMYPEVFENHPNLKQVYMLDNKYNINQLNMSFYDCWEDLRNYSETSPQRDKMHRTDIYNLPFQADLAEKEPKMYFKKDEKSVLNKKSGYTYIGIQCDASHAYRRYDKGQELAEYILNEDLNNIVVLLGSYDFVKGINNKRIIDYQGKTTRRQVMNIVRDLDYLVAADSGLMHVALSLHVPTVCMFSIISPDFRTRYYTGQYKVIWKDLECKGCGNWHMFNCKHGNKKIKDTYIPPCMDIQPKEIYDLIKQMPKEENKRIFYNDSEIVEKSQFKVIQKEAVKDVHIIPSRKTKKLTMPVILLNEEKNLPRFIELVMKNPNVGRTIAIDGGSTDKSVEMIKKAGAEVYIHPYLKDYFEMQAMQRNISCSYCKQGEKIILMDLDECFSKELSDYLPALAESNINFGLISRRTFEYYKDIEEPGKRIKDYPDYQPRFYTWDRRYKFVGGAHHNTVNTPDPVLINKDIIHYEREGKDREAMERQWATMMQGVRKYA